MAKSLISLDERFDAKVNKSGPRQPHMNTRCWQWTGSNNPGCVRPSHLSYGTHRQNCLDKVQRGRHQDGRGVKNPAAVLTESRIRRIRSSSRTQVELAAKYGVTQATISLIIRRKTWQHVE